MPIFGKLWKQNVSVITLSMICFDFTGLQHPLHHHLGYPWQGPIIQPCHENMQIVHFREIFYYVPPQENNLESEDRTVLTLSPPRQTFAFSPKKEEIKHIGRGPSLKPLSLSSCHFFPFRSMFYI